MRLFSLRTGLLVLCILLVFPLVVGAQSGGQIAIGDTISGELTLSQPSVSYSYQGRAGDVLTITLTSDDFDAFLTLEDASGFRIASDDDSGGGSNAELTAVTLPSDGVYRVVVDSYNRASSGAFTLTLEGTQNVPAEPVTAGVITAGQVVEAELTGATLAAAYTFDGLAGQQVTITLVSDAFDGYLVLQDAAGNELATDDDSAGNLNPRIRDFTLPADGTYTIIATSYNNATPGRYTLTLDIAGVVAPLPASPTPPPPPVTPVVSGSDTLPLNTPLAATLSANQPATYTFTGTAGQVVTITLESAVFDAYLVLQDAAGNELATDDDSAGNLNARIRDFVLPAAGVYTVVVNSFGGGTAGDFTLTLETGSGAVAPVTATPTPLPPPPTLAAPVTPVVSSSDTLQPNVPLSGTLSADQSASYTFTGAAGQVVIITLESSAFDAFLTLQDAAGNILATDDDSAGNFNARIRDFALPADGVYTAVVSSFGSGAAGAFTLTLETAGGAVAPVPASPTPLPPPPPTPVASSSDTLQPNTPLAGTLSADQSASYTFTGAAGQTVTITLESSAFDAYLTLQDAAGNILATDDDSAGDFNARIRDFALPADGVYTVVVSSFGSGAAGAFTLTLETAGSAAVIPAAPTLPPPPVTPAGSSSDTLQPNTPLSGTLSADQPSLYTFTGTAGQTVTITLESAVFDAYLILRDAAGNDLATDDDSAGNLNARIRDFALPAAGVYTVVVNSFGGGTAGSFTLTLETGTGAAVIPASPTPPPVIGGGNVLQPSVPLAGELVANQPALYIFSGEAGQVVTITLESTMFDSYLELQDAAGNELARDDDSAGNLNARIQDLRLPANGTYTVIVTSFDGSAAGAFVLTLESGGSAAGQPTPVPSLAAGQIAAGQVVSGELTAAQLTMTYDLVGEPGSAVSVTLNSDAFDSYLTVVDADGNEVASDDDSGGNLNSRIAVLRLEPGKSYSIVVSSLGGTETGAYTLQVAAVVLSNGGAMTVGESVVGYLDGNRPNYTFSGTAGDMVVITLASDDFDTFLTLYDDAGNELASDDDSAGYLNAQIAFFTLPATSTYTIEVSAFDNGVGGYTLSINVATVRPIEYTQRVEGTLDTTSPVNGFRFRGQAGDVVVISMDSAEIDSYLTLLDATGQVITANDDSGSSLNSRIGPFTLPETGDYLIGARSYSDGVFGAYTLRLDRVTLTPVSYGESISGTFDALNSMLYYSFEGHSGDVVSLNVAGDNGLDTMLTLDGPGNYQIGFDDDGGAGNDPELDHLILTENGTYIVLVQPFSPGRSGSFTLNVNGVLPASLEDSPLEVQLSGKRTQDIVVFKGVAGETVTLTAQIASGWETAEPYIEVAQNGNLLASETLSGDTVYRLEVTVPESGIVNVLVTDYGTGPTVVELHLLRPGE